MEAGKHQCGIRILMIARSRFKEKSCEFQE